MLNRRSPDADRRALVRLDEHQSAILTLLRDEEAMLTDERRDVAGLARARWTMMRALTAYQLFKHREIFDPAIAGKVLRDGLKAERMKAACIAIGDDFRDHVQRWSGSDVAGDWSRYQPAALTMVKRLRAHVARERVDVASLLELA